MRTTPSLPHRLCLVALALILSAGLSSTVSAQTVTEALVLPGDLPTPPSENLGYGAGVAMRGDTLFVGAPGGEYLDPGRVDIYERDGVGWIFTASLFPDVPSDDNANFGRALAVDGNVLAVTAARALVVFREVAGVWRQEAQFIEELESIGSATQIAMGGGRIAVAREPSAVLFQETSSGWEFDALVSTASTPIGTEADLAALEITADTFFLGVLTYGGFGAEFHTDSRLIVFSRVDGEWEYQKLLPGGNSIHERDGVVLTTSVNQVVVWLVGTSHNTAAFLLGQSGDEWVITEQIEDPVGQWPRGVIAGELLVLIGQLLQSGKSLPHLMSFKQGVSGRWEVFESELLDPVVNLWPSSAHSGDSWDLAHTDTHAAVAHTSFLQGPTEDGGAIVLRLSPFGKIESGELAGSSDDPPSLVATGTLLPGSDNTLTLRGALPSSTSALLSGLGLAELPFKGGVLVPTPNLIFNSLLALPVNAQGKLTLNFQWPADIPSGTKLYVQHWIVDPAGPLGYSASNGLELVGQ